MKVTAVANLKGGVGKTLVVGNLGHAYVAQSVPTLLLDLDPQGNLTQHFTSFTPDDPPNVSMADVLDRSSDATLADAIVETRRSGLFLVPSGFDELQAVQDTLVGRPGAEFSVKRALDSLPAGQFAAVMIDCRPATDLVTRNAFIAADQVLIVLQPEADALRGFDFTLVAIDDLQMYLGKELPVAGFVVNQVDYRRNDHKKQLEWIKQRSAADSIPILGDPIPVSTDLSKLNAVGMGIDEMSSPSIRLRTLAAGFQTIVNALREEQSAA